MRQAWVRHVPRRTLTPPPPGSAAARQPGIRQVRERGRRPPACASPLGRRCTWGIPALPSEGGGHLKGGGSVSFLLPFSFSWVRRQCQAHTSATPHLRAGPRPWAPWLRRRARRRECTCGGAGSAAFTSLGRAGAPSSIWRNVPAFGVVFSCPQEPLPPHVKPVASLPGQPLLGEGTVFGAQGRPDVQQEGPGMRGGGRGSARALRPGSRLSSGARPRKRCARSQAPAFPSSPTTPGPQGPLHPLSVQNQFIWVTVKAQRPGQLEGVASFGPNAWSFFQPQAKAFRVPGQRRDAARAGGASASQTGLQSPGWERAGSLSFW